MRKILVRLLDEGTTVYRPVFCSEISPLVFKIEEDQLYNQDDEHWEFPPGSVVEVEIRKIENEPRLVATRLLQT